jgi:hypothetical protein
MLEQQLPAALLQDEAPWVVEYRLGRPQPQPREIRLPVPYYRQGDSAVPGQGPRMCQSSTLAMVVSYLRPNALAGAGQPDDQYLRRVQQYGDTTDAQAQLRALKALGVDARFRSDLDWDDVDAQLEQQLPVPVGILHHGPVSALSGGGHWVLIIGRSADGQRYLVHDPAGELDLVNGNYGLGRPGQAVWYSKLNLGRRWLIEGPNSGWGYLVRR